ncbi:MAG TPA: hypothetical protein DCR55_13130 [Lentisphaeria bacterium]|nr:hypothetical protein [Lentisphaeria bacterium]
MPPVRYKLVVLFCGAIAMANGFAPGSQISMKDFKLSGEQYSITGEQATFMAETVRLTQMTAWLKQSDNNIKLSAPRCSLDRINRRAASRTAVRIEGKNIIMTGRGFDVDFEAQRVRVRRDVKVVISHNGAISKQLLGKDPK